MCASIGRSWGCDLAILEPIPVLLRRGERIEIRSGAAADAPALFRHIHRVLSEHKHTVTAPDEIENGEAGIRDRLERYAADPGQLILVACAEGALVGELTLTGERRRRLRHNCTIGLSIATDWRGRGVGRALIESAVLWAQRQPNIEKMNLAVFARNTRAIRLYESLGFRREGCREGYIRLGDGDYDDDILMSRRIRPRPDRAGA